MNLDIHLIPAKASDNDPLAQRAYAALVWHPENELIEMPAGLPVEQAAAEVALTVAFAVMRTIAPNINGSEGAEIFLNAISRRSHESEARRRG